jgi:hypothetical protein
MSNKLPTNRQNKTKRNLLVHEYCVNKEKLDDGVRRGFFFGFCECFMQRVVEIFEFVDFDVVVDIVVVVVVGGGGGSGDGGGVDRDDGEGCDIFFIAFFL